MAPYTAYHYRYFENLFKEYASRRVPKNRPLLYQGEIPTMAFYIRSGVVKIYNITGGGEERIVGYEGPGSLMPAEWLFNRSKVSLYYYDAFTNCEVIRIDKEKLRQALDKKPELASIILERTLSMYIGSTIHLHALQQSWARQKILYLLQYLVLRFGKKKDSKNQQVDLRLTHQEVANLVGLTRETVSTELSKLIKEGVLKMSDSKYVVNMDKATRMLGEDDFNQITL